MSTRSMLNNIKILNKPLNKGYEEFEKRAKRHREYEIYGWKIEIVDDMFENPKTTEITLNPAFINALDLLRNEKVSYGLQENNGINYVLTEYLDEESNQIVATAYSPTSGRISSCTKSPVTQKLQGARAINGVEGDGTEVWLSLLVTLINVGYMDDQWIKDFGGEPVAKAISKDVSHLLDKAVAPGENSVRVITHYSVQQRLWDYMEDSRLPLLFNTTMAKADNISQQALESDMYVPNTDIVGEFKVFIASGKNAKRNITK